MGAATPLKGLSVVALRKLLYVLIPPKPLGVGDNLGGRG